MELGDIPWGPDVLYTQVLSDTAVCNYFGNFFDDSSNVSYTPPPVITGLQDLSNGQYLPFQPVVDTPQSANQYLIVYGHDLTAAGLSNPPTICIDTSTCSSGGTITVTGFHLGSGWYATDAQINIPFWVDANATPGTYTISLATVGGQTQSSFSVGDASPVITGLSSNSFVVGVNQTIVVSGAHFGTNCPSITLPFTTSTLATSQCLDNAVTVNLTPSGAGSGSLTLKAQGYGGLPFDPQSGGESQTAIASVSATAPPPLPVYTIVLREFIRSNYVPGPPTVCLPPWNYFHGDSRNFMATPPPETPSSNPYRAMQTSIVQPETSMSPSGVGGSASALSGTTRQYDSGSLILGNDPAGSGMIINPSIPDNVVNCTGGAVLIGKETAANPSLPSAPTRVNSHSVSVVFSGTGVNPVTPALLTPAFKWNVTVTVDHTDPSAVKASASGSHTCYPANEIWVTSSSNLGAPYYIWEYGPGGTTPNTGYDESISYLTGCLTGLYSAINVNGSTTLPK